MPSRRGEQRRHDSMRSPLRVTVTTACSWDTIIPFDILWRSFKRVIKPRGAIVLTASQPFTSALVMSNPKMFRYEWIWRKNKPTGMMNAQFRPLKAHESVLVFSPAVTRANQFGNEAYAYFPQGTTKGSMRVKSKSKTSALNNLRGIKPGYHVRDTFNFPSSVLDFALDNGSHPTQKPVALFRYLIRTYTQPGELVLDPCVGSGTTALAAREESRQFICGDTALEYVEVARKRLDAPYTLPMFTEAQS